LPGQAGEAGKPGRIDALYRLHAPDALRLAYLLTGDATLAEDLAQEAFVRAFGRFQHVRNPESFWWYLRRTVVNLSRSHWRHRKAERAYLARQRTTEPSVQPDVGARDRMRRALLHLRPEQRAAVVLRFYEDLTEAQTAEALGCPVGTVKSMVSRAMERLRTELGGED